MTRFVVLVNFLEKGFSNVAESPMRAEQFRAEAAKDGVTVETALWTLGTYDGVLVINAPDELTAAAAVLKLGRDGNVRTTMMRALDADEFGQVLSKITS